MEKTWKPTVAGILCIIAGVLCVIPSIVVGGIYTPIGAGLAIVAIVPIVGGIFALRRRTWGLALAGSIFTLINTVVIGIFLATFFVMLLLGMLGASMDNPGAPAFESVSLDPLFIALIVGLAICPVMGTLAIIFIIKGKREFR